MTISKLQREHTERYIAGMLQRGFSWEDANNIRLIEKTLHSWSEHECNGTIQRDGEKGDGKPYRYYNDEYGCPTLKSRSPCADRERGALKRLDKIMAKYPDFTVFIQGDPRGGILYILRKSDVDGKDVSTIYSSVGLCVQ